MALAAALLPAARCCDCALRQDAEQILHVMADLVRDHIGLGEFAGLAGAAVEALLRSRRRTRCRDRCACRADNRTAPSPLARSRSRPARRRDRAAAAPARTAGRWRGKFPSTRPRCCRAPRRRTGRSGPWACRRAAPVAARSADIASRRRLRISAPPMSTLGSMPSAQPIRPSTTMVPMPSPPRPTGIPKPPPPKPPPPSLSRSSSTLSLRRKSSQRMKSLHPFARIIAGEPRAVQSPTLSMPI